MNIYNIRAVFFLCRYIWDFSIGEIMGTTRSIRAARFAGRVVKITTIDAILLKIAGAKSIKVSSPADYVNYLESVLISYGKLPLFI